MGSLRVPNSHEGGAVSLYQSHIEESIKQNILQREGKSRMTPKLKEMWEKECKASISLKAVQNVPRGTFKTDLQISIGFVSVLADFPTISALRYKVLWNSKHLLNLHFVYHLHKLSFVPLIGLFCSVCVKSTQKGCFLCLVRPRSICPSCCVVLLYGLLLLFRPSIR